MQNDFLFFVVVVILLFAVWVGGGGPSRPISFSGPYLNPITGPDATNRAYGDPTSFSSFNLSLGGTQAEPSPSRGKVTISRDSTGPTQSDPEREYVILRFNGNTSDSVSLSGWRLTSKETGRTVTIGTGTETPRQGSVNTAGPITLTVGTEVIIATDRSPIGVSFRENKCTGYFEERQDFYPTLTMSCPTPGEEYNRSGDREDTECSSYIRSLSSCVTVTRVPGNLSNQCEDFIDERLNYAGCVAIHRADADFLRPTWRVFLGSSKELWRNEQETLMLLDSSGKLVDAFSY